MSNLIEAAPEEPGNGPGGSNRPFVLIALALATLLLVGLLLILGYAAATRFGLFGSRAAVAPDAATQASAAPGTATALALASAAGTLSPASAATSVAAAATAVANGTLVPGATGTSAAATSVAVAAVAAPATRAPGATSVALAATSTAPTATPTLVVGGAANTPAADSTGGPAGSTPAATSSIVGPAPSSVAATVAASGGVGDASAKSPPGANSNLPGTGIELDILMLGGLMLVLLVLARVFRLALGR